VPVTGAGRRLPGKARFAKPTRLSRHAVEHDSGDRGSLRSGGLALLHGRWSRQWKGLDGLKSMYGSQARYPPAARWKLALIIDNPFTPSSRLARASALPYLSSRSG